MLVNQEVGGRAFAVATTTVLSVSVVLVTLDGSVRSLERMTSEESQVSSPEAVISSSGMGWLRTDGKHIVDSEGSNQIDSFITSKSSINNRHS